MGFPSCYRFNDKMVLMQSFQNRSSSNTNMLFIFKCVYCSPLISMSVCPSVLYSSLPGLLCICRYATCLLAIPIVFLSFLFLPFCLSVQLSVSVSTCLSACPPACLCIIYLFIVLAVSSVCCVGWRPSCRASL